MTGKNHIVFYLDQTRTITRSEKEILCVWVSLFFGLQNFLSVLLGESQGHGSEKLIHSHMYLRSKVSGEQEGQNHKQIVGKDLQGKGKNIKI